MEMALHPFVVHLLHLDRQQLEEIQNVLIGLTPKIATGGEHVLEGGGL